MNKELQRKIMEVCIECGGGIEGTVRCQGTM